MNHQVLLADDSITIQKVIKITLANQPYDITEASSEAELFQKLPVIQPKIVFLDFNLSDKFSGYELCTKIREIVPSAKILLLLGTFDTVDDAAMEKCGASDKIVKPFDSNKFIAICRQLIETFDEGEIAYPSDKNLEEPSPVIGEEPEDQWQMSHATDPMIQVGQVEKPEPTAPYNLDTLNALDQEINDWGMSVPDVIGKGPATSRMELPPVISSKPVEKAAEKPSAPVQAKTPSEADQKFPENSDLDYPMMDSFSAPAAEEPKTERKKPQLVSIESFNVEPEALELEGNYVEDKTDIGSLEAQIHDEVADDLWHADEFEDLKEKVASKIDEMKSGFQPTRNDFDESLFKPIDDQDSVTWNDVSSDIFAKPQFEPTVTSTKLPSTDELMKQLRPEMEELVKKYVKEYMDEMFRKNVEKVTWEVIPDLAENLIRQELGKISDKIIGQS